MPSKIRIIAGKYKGKLIPVLALPNLRPTPNRVRETLFNWLMFDIRQAVCLDAFAGSGALGIEACSRGASKVILLEKDPMIFNKLNQTVASFNDSSLHAIQTDFSSFIATTKIKFDIIFLDPPFKDDALTTCLNILKSSPALKQQGLVYLESENKLPQLADTFSIIKTAKAGKVFYGLGRLVDKAWQVVQSAKL
ncbi:MAG: 16S rRNA (guanine(966)-N(2))-methyltransferase RsmD [Legionellales bacterium RIFCSPHIGHO2_12_FULL_37_14]|nr:MAG: 16S rRNA (guanine(966)-N(2))-methyltransferase RsmD [Legionellales bacterium RIFCSPHIGHO2_12_FULL_37_14]